MLVGCALVLMWGAAGAATPKRAVFRVTLTAVLTKDSMSRRVVDGACDEVTTTAGHWRMTLAARRPSTIVVVGPSGPGRPVRFAQSTIRRIVGSASQRGTTLVQNPGGRCGAPTQRIDCGRGAASFRGATARISSPRRRIARLDRLQGASAARSLRGRCDAEPAEIRAIRTDLGIADAPLSVADFFDRNVPRLYLTGNTEQETTLEGEVEGTVIERVRWTLVFTRVR
jgi:hypothetical protein